MNWLMKRIRWLLYIMLSRPRQIKDKERIALESAELKMLNNKRDSIRIRADGAVEIRVAPQSKSRWCAICSSDSYISTPSRLQLIWHWPGITADVKQTVKAVKFVRQGKTKGAGSRQRLYAGTPWQAVVINLVEPFPETAKVSMWILILTDHFTRWRDPLAIPDDTVSVVANTLDECVFCYLGLLEQIHTDQGAQF